MFIIDCEVYTNYFLIMFKRLEDGAVAYFEQFDGQELNRSRLRQLMRNGTTISFNGNNYDLWIINAALAGKSCKQLKMFSDDIIKTNLQAWQVAKSHGIRQESRWDHIDVIEVAPGRSGLKIYGGRMHSPKLQDLPIAPDELISPEQRLLLKRYCLNDLDTTEKLYRMLEPAIKLREQIGAEYGGIDLRSKSDAQIAEAVIKHELQEMTGNTYKPRKVAPGHICRYVDPKIVSFQTKELQDIFRKIKGSDFPVGTNGAVKLPEWLSKTKIKIGGSAYQMGIGGLHSCEKGQSVVARDDQMLADFDVASYYPSIILKLKLAPKSMGADFLKVYQGIVTRRLQAKARGDKLTADTLKIVVNGSFGKLGSMYSALYAPELMIQTTITGQLCLLMLIEWVEGMGAKVVSANTDGIVVLFDKRKEPWLEEVMFDWMLTTSFELERSDYRAIHSRDVNNYMAVKPDGKVKRKGVYAENALNKNPDFAIVPDAVAAFLSKGTPVEDTIRSSLNVRGFVTIRQVTGGGFWRDEYLGKAVRFYYSTEVGADECIHYAKNSNKVPRSDGAKPMMELPDMLPGDIDFDRYIAMAREALKDMGVANA
jgi:hypothetical protein